MSLTSTDDHAIPQLPSFRLDGKRALITGAGTGLGRAAAHALAQSGAYVIVNGRRQEPLDTVVGEIKSNGGEAQISAFDVQDRQAMPEAIEQLGQIDILVNNAGINKPQSFTDVSFENLDAIVDLNLRAAFGVAQTVARSMIAHQSKGSIINMSSQMGHVGGANRSAYCGTKHAMEGFTKAAAIDLGPHAIRMNTVCPTFIVTPLTRPFFDNEDFLEDTLRRIPLGRLGEQSEVMGAVVFLASDASTLITGTSILVDGGWTAQ